MTVRTPSKTIAGNAYDFHLQNNCYNVFECLYTELDAKAMLQDEEETGDEIEEASENENESGDEEMEDRSSDADHEFNDSESEENDEDGNAGWANTFAKVLQQDKPRDKKYLALSRAKKLADRKEKEDPKAAKSVTFEIAGGAQDDSEDVKPQVDEAKPSAQELDFALLERKERNNKLLELRVKPALMDRERERSFKRIATKGVVQLFNAVRSQQRDLVSRLEQAGPLDHKRDEVLNNINKRQFLDMLMGGKRAKSENVDNPVKSEETNQQDETPSRPSQWSVLRDDFMTNKKIASHWDNDDQDDEGQQSVDGSDGIDSDD